MMNRLRGTVNRSLEYGSVTQVSPRLSSSIKVMSSPNRAATFPRFTSSMSRVNE